MSDPIPVWQQFCELTGAPADERQRAEIEERLRSEARRYELFWLRPDPIQSFEGFFKGKDDLYRQWLAERAADVPVIPPTPVDRIDGLTAQARAAALLHAEALVAILRG